MSLLLILRIFVFFFLKRLDSFLIGQFYFYLFEFSRWYLATENSAKLKTIFALYHWPSRLGLQNTPTGSLQKGKTPLHECATYDTKQSGRGASVKLELWEIRSISSLPSLPGPLWFSVVSPDRVLYDSDRTVWHLSYLLMLNWIVCNINHFTFNCV